VDRILNSLHHGAVGWFGDAAYRVIGPVPAIIATAVLAGVLVAVHRDLRAASTFAVTIAVTWLPAALVKILVGRPRPELAALPHPPAPQSDASYPSGHAVFATALVVAAILVTRSVVLRRVWLVVGILGIVAVGFLLVSDGVHYPTDVAASIVWAAGIAPAVSAVWQRFGIPRIPLLRQGRRSAPS
jgi:undecaprenyl-diphosphatase